MPAPSTNSTPWSFVPQDSALDLDLPSRIPIQEPFRIGRREGFELCLDCRNVSGLHAEVLEFDGKLYINDLESTNGTIVNGETIRAKTLLHDGDLVQIGQITFVVSGVKDDAPMRTLLFNEPVAAETTEDRFARLLVDGVTPFFQSIHKINGQQNEVVGYEVLGRSKLFGLKTPEQMFAVATDLAKEAELSRILRVRGFEAAESLSSELQLFVNTHPAELDFEEIQQSLQIVHDAFPKRQMMLELPESVLYTPDTYRDLFELARKLGVKITVYDFGAGQIRLAELARIKPDVVKFDCALTQKIDQAEDDRKRLVSAMVKMVTELDIASMAEYVETKQEHNTLREMGFELGQGFYYGHPTSIETLPQKTDEGPTTIQKNDKAKPARPPEIVRQAEAIDAVRESEDSKAFEESVEAIEEVEAVESSEVKTHGASYLLELNPKYFTLQVRFALNQETAKKFMAAQTARGDYSIYRKISTGKEWYVVVFNEYKTLKAANEAKKLFAESGYSCWARQIAHVHREIEAMAKVDSEANQLSLKDILL